LNSPQAGCCFCQKLMFDALLCCAVLAGK